MPILLHPLGLAAGHVLRLPSCRLCSAVRRRLITLAAWLVRGGCSAARAQTLRSCARVCCASAGQRGQRRCRLAWRLATPV